MVYLWLDHFIIFSRIVVPVVMELQMFKLHPRCKSQTYLNIFPKLISAEAFPSTHCQSCRRQAGRQGTLVTARQSNRWDLPFPLVCLLSRSLPLLHTYTCTTTAQPPHIKTNTHHSSPLERSISRDHTASSGSQALLTRSVDVDGSFTQADS